MKNGFIERLRCAKHNLLDRPWFRVYYRSGLYHVHTNDGVHLKFTHNPFQPFMEIWGYLKEGEWHLEAGMNVLDAGAYLGEFSLYAAARVGSTGRIFLMEPDPSNLKRLEEIFVLNGGKPENLEVIDAGLWKESGSLEFAAGINGRSTLNVGGAEGIEHGGLHRFDEKIVRANMLTVSVMSLPDFARAYKLERLDFVKMDIEGAEVEAVESADFILSKFKPKFAIASYHLRAGKRTAEFLRPLFQSANYFVESGFPWHLTTYAAPVRFSR
jgi:FkbM family methyltransferase